MPKNHRVRFADHRSGRVVYVSSCLLDQNRRYPGIAMGQGALQDLFLPLVEDGIGIEQLPCLECMGWGGVSRISVFRFIPTMFRHADSKLLPILRRVAGVWLLRYRRLCKRVAQRVVRDMKDLADSGYDIVGIIAMNDSPTCGVTKTISIIDFVTKSKSMGLKLEDLTSPSFDKIKQILPALLVDGHGLFITELLSALRRQAMTVRILQFNPWDDPKSEAQRVVGQIRH